MPEDKIVIIDEIQKLLELLDKVQLLIEEKGKSPLNFWRSSNGDEVDFVLADKTAIEVKGKQQVPDRDFKGLYSLKEEELLKNHILVCDEDAPREKTGISALPWRTFLERLWNDEFV